MKKILILPQGRFKHKLGMQVVDDLAMERVVDSLKNASRDIPVDYGHESFSTPVAPAAGWLDFRSLKKEADGLYGIINWTDEALEKISDRKFRYLSPVLAFNPERSKEGELYIERIISIGLTNHPNIESMQPLFNQLQLEGTMDEQFEKLKSALNMPKDAAQSEMLERGIESIEKLKAVQEELLQLKLALGLKPDASAEETMARINQASPAASPDAELSPSREEWMALKEEMATLKEKEISSKVTEAVNSGKIMPTQTEWAKNYAATDPDGFSEFLINSRPLMQIGELIPKNLSGKTELAPLSPGQEKMNRLLGISREIFDKYNNSPK